MSTGAIELARHYLRQQPVHHEAEAIPGWEGEGPEYDQASQDAGVFTIRKRR